VAIVTWTASVGLTLTFRDRTRMTLTTPSGSTATFDILDIFPFTSESKRMGIVVRDTQTGEISFLQKGADVVMARIVQRNDWLEEETANMAREGLRTLVMARKRISGTLYTEFKDAYRAASISLEGRNEAMANVVDKYLEHDLELLGLTGVEDKLQDDVKGTLELLRNAGIRIWMLTGDKVETARCIAISTKLVARGQYIHEMSKGKSILVWSFWLTILLTVFLSFQSGIPIKFEITWSSSKINLIVVWSSMGNLYRFVLVYFYVRFPALTPCATNSSV
jgi:phospholipid-translocating ATPase